MPEQKVESGRIATGAVTGDKVANNAIRGNNIVAGTVTGNLIANNAVAGNNIVSGSISNSKLAEPNAFEDYFLLGSL
jgi:trimeric autotransporter adhesin